jgi:F-type H+-transporting ATPase subunit a
MSSAILHIKDAYYFEVPKFLWPSDRKSIKDFPEHYIRLDPEYQSWEAERIYDEMAASGAFQNVPPKDELISEWDHWRHESANFAKPFDRYLEEAPSQAWFQKQMALGKFAKQGNGKNFAEETNADYTARLEKAKTLSEKWNFAKTKAEDVQAHIEHIGGDWPQEKIDAYNHELHGKIMIPQPFGKLRNNYQPESGFAISKFMILEVAVALALVVIFKLLSSRLKDGRVPKGRLWNLFETFLLFIRDGIARPAIGHHDADRFVPLLWTIFMFVLGCNLLGMLPWLGSPTASFSVTAALAFVTFATVVIAGSKQFGFIGFLKNQVPHMDLPIFLKIPVLLILFPIELLGLLIKHAVLAFRLLANMVAGHMVLLGILGLATAVAASASFPYIATASVIGSTLLSCLELFVAFLQAYVFTFLSALFIGAAVHHH